MGRVVSFSEFGSYFASIQFGDQVAKGALLDTNILISLTYEVKSNHEEVVAFFTKYLAPACDNGFRLFTTVNTRSEFLDFNRRLIMTENLRDAVEEKSLWKIPSQAKAQIQYQSGQLTRREKQGADPVFNDTQLKAIKSSFSAGRFSGQAGWLVLCEDMHSGQLEIAENNLTGLGVEYVSQHESSQKELFHKKIDWPDARLIAESTCLGLADAMIINALQCSRFPFVVSTDFDLGYAVLASGDLKDIVMPDSVAKKYREYHFETNT